MNDSDLTRRDFLRAGAAAGLGTAAALHGFPATAEARESDAASPPASDEPPPSGAIRVRQAAP